MISLRLNYEELIGSANIISMTERGREHPALHQNAARRDAHIEAAHGLLFGPRSRNQSRWDRDRARSLRYWDKTGEIWVGKLSTAVLGRQRPWLERTIAAGRMATLSAPAHSAGAAAR